MKSETQSHRAERRVSAATSLKEIIVLLSAATLTTGLGQIATTLFRERQLTSDTGGLFCFLLLLFNVLRFYHGNLRLIDDNYCYHTENGRRGGFEVENRTASIGLDFLFAVSLAVTFALSAFFIHSHTIFVIFVIVALVIDVIWHLATRRRENSESAAKFSNVWFMNNITFIVFSVFAALGVSYYESGHLSLFLYSDNLFIWLYVIMLINTILDFVLSRDFYFPRPDFTSPR